MTRALCSLLILLASLLTFSSSRGATREFRCFWVDAWNPGFRTAEQVTKLVADVRAANCNAIFVQVRKRGDAYYDGSPFESKVKLKDPKFDPLADLVVKAHDTNQGPRVEVHAWMVTYPIATQMKLTKTNAPPIIRAKADPKHVFNRHPEWLCQTKKGATFDGHSYNLDPGHPEVQKYLVQIAMDIITRYDVDGLHFDYVRYPSEFWGYNPVAIERFKKLYNKTESPAPADHDWLQFRRDQITALMRQFYLCAIDKKPSLKISASTVAWSSGIATRTEWKETMAFRTALQDWRAWMEEGILDINVPMLFFKEDKPKYAADFRDWVQFVKDHKYDRHAIIGLGAWQNPTSSTLQQLSVVRTPSERGNSADGVALCSYAVPNPQTNRVDFIKALTDSKQEKTRVFDQPVSTPEMPWKIKPTKGHLKGIIYDNRNTGLDGAVITVGGPAEKVIRSDATGFFGAVDLPPGTYSIVASFGGKSITNTTTITSGAVTTSDIFIKATASSDVRSNPQ